jgi:hypothetical protein
MKHAYKKEQLFMVSLGGTTLAVRLHEMAQEMSYQLWCN